MYLYRSLLARAEADDPVRVGLIGAGKFGSMFLAQVPTTLGMAVTAIADLDTEQAYDRIGSGRRVPPGETVGSGPLRVVEVPRCRMTGQGVGPEGEVPDQRGPRGDRVDLVYGKRALVVTGVELAGRALAVGGERGQGDE